MLAPLPEYRVKARNTSATSENRIHDDTVARQYGFPGALVPGVTVYAYLTQPIVAGLGTGWLERGTATVRFVKPILDAEEVVVTGELTERNERVVSGTVKATTARAGECAAATFTIPAGMPTPVNVALYREAPLPANRPDATRAALDAIAALGSPAATYDEAQASAYADDVSDPLAFYRGPNGRVHPAFYLKLANRALSENVRLGPWVHVSSAVRHLAAAHVGATLTVRGRVRSLFEKKDREYVELDLLLFAGPRPAAHVLHTAIYRLPSPTA